MIRRKTSPPRHKISPAKIFQEAPFINFLSTRTICRGRKLVRKIIPYTYITSPYMPHDILSGPALASSVVPRTAKPKSQAHPNQQTTSTVVMIEPASFRHNFQTALDDDYQKRPDNITEDEAKSLGTLSREEAFAKHPGLQERVAALDIETHSRAREEFAAMVQILRAKMINVIVIPDILEHDTPDSIFPNNPASTHAEGGGTFMKHAMRNSNRRPEKRLPIQEALASAGFKIRHTVDFSALEETGDFNEGTGSMVLDRVNKIAYASISQRTTQNGVDAFAREMEYTPITFRSHDRLHDNHPVYHANVVMSVGNNFAVICSEAITDPQEREMVLASLRATGKEIIEITTEQMNGFAGNILEVQNIMGEPMIVMSQTAHDTFTAEQLARLSQYGEIVASSIPTIEEHGGGSARCMLLEVHLPKEEVH